MVGGYTRVLNVIILKMNTIEDLNFTGVYPEERAYKSLWIGL